MARWNITWQCEVNAWMHELDLGKRGVHVWIRKRVRLNYPRMINVNVESWKETIMEYWTLEGEKELMKESDGVMLLSIEHWWREHKHYGSLNTGKRNRTELKVEEASAWKIEGRWSWTVVVEIQNSVKYAMKRRGSLEKKEGSINERGGLWDYHGCGLETRGWNNEMPVSGEAKEERVVFPSNDRKRVMTLQGVGVVVLQQRVVCCNQEELHL